MRPPSSGSRYSALLKPCHSMQALPNLQFGSTLAPSGLKSWAYMAVVGADA